MCAGAAAGSRIDEVARTLPAIVGVGQQVVHDVGTPDLDVELGEVEMHPTRLGVERVEVDDHDDRVGRLVVHSMPEGRVVGCDLRVGDDLVVVHLVEGERVVAVQRPVAATNLVHPAHQVSQALGLLEVPVTDGVLLRVVVLL